MSNVYAGKSLRDPMSLKSGGAPVARVRNDDENLAWCAWSAGLAAPRFTIENADAPGYVLMLEVEGGRIVDYCDV